MQRPSRFHVAGWEWLETSPRACSIGVVVAHLLLTEPARVQFSYRVLRSQHASDEPHDGADDDDGSDDAHAEHGSLFSLWLP